MLKDCNYSAMVVKTSLYKPDSSETDPFVKADVRAWVAALKVVITKKDPFKQAEAVRKCLITHIDNLNTYDIVIEQALSEMN